MLRRLRAEGTSIIFISHKLGEVLAIADRITVLRRGKTIETVQREGATEESLARLMVGRDVLLRVEKKPAEPGEPLLRVEDLRVLEDRGFECIRGISFEVRAGEIVGLAGLIGAGRTELAETIFGVRKRLAGEVRLDGKPRRHRLREGSSLRAEQDHSRPGLPQRLDRAQPLGQDERRARFQQIDARSDRHLGDAKRLVGRGEVERDLDERVIELSAYLAGRDDLDVLLPFGPGCGPYAEQLPERFHMDFQCLPGEAQQVRANVFFSDDEGRLLFAFADGCTGPCVTDPAANTFEDKATIVRQTGGRGPGQAHGGKVGGPASLRRQLETDVSARKTDAAGCDAHHDVDRGQERQREQVRLGQHAHRKRDQTAKVGGERRGENRLVRQPIGKLAPGVKREGIGDLACGPERTTCRSGKLRTRG